MNKLTLIGCSLVAANTHLVFAANDTTLQATATTVRLQLVNSCSLNTLTTGTAELGTLDFGKIYKTNAIADASTSLGNGTLVLRCTPGTTAKITIGAGLYGSNVNNRKMRLVSGSATLNYQLYTTAARQTVWDDTTGISVSFVTDTSMNISVYGRVLVQTTPVSGSYSDQVLVTVSY